ncbi:Di-copper centre-containing protein, partial [Lojkania enalia]
MLYYGPLDLSNYSQVKEQVVVIYRHLRSRSMPITKYEDEYWPDWALDVLRNWANTGCRRAQTDPIVRKEIIPASPDPPVKFRVRKDVMSMTEEEINEYRMKLDDVLGAREKDSRWQELGWLHAQWCLHYQEATFFWHRAMLVYMEGLIDFPIPFWNGFAKESANPESAFAGIPNVFLEDEYFHPIAKEWRKNPLKYALACNPQGSDPSPVKRDSILENGKSTTDNTAWAKKIKDLMTLYHEQIKNALDTSTYSWPQETGFPWANLPAFKENMPDSDYAHRTTFDGIFEQPHDNMHGWLGGIGGDMSDNTKTGFDPLFYSMHANFDRIVAAWQSQHPNQTYSSNFPLRPFTDGAKVLSYEESRQYMFTTLGDMAKDTRTMGYIYAPPASPDAAPLRTQAFGPKAVSQGGHAVVTSAKLMAAKGVKVKGDVESVKVPYVVFEDVRCTTESYQINVYLDEGSEATFIGQSTRLGMGQGDIRNGGLKNRQRCEKSTITRAIEVKQFAKQLEEDGGRIRLEVRNLSTGNKVSEEEAARLKGFQARVVWM